MPANAPLLCPQPNCLTADNQPCKVNKICQRVPAHCSQCCKALGGCKMHQVTSGSTVFQVATPQEHEPQPVANTSSGPLTPEIPAPIRSTYARPLSADYVNGYILAHQECEQLAHQLMLQQTALTNMNNTIQIAVWYKVH